MTYPPPQGHTPPQSTGPAPAGYDAYRSATQHTERPGLSAALAVAVLLQFALAAALVLQTVGLWQHTGDAVRGFAAAVEREVDERAPEIVAREAERTGVPEEIAWEEYERQRAELDVEADLERAAREGGGDYVDEDLNPSGVFTIPAFATAGLLMLSGILLLFRRNGARVLSFIVHPFLLLGCGAFSAGLLALPKVAGEELGDGIASGGGPAENALRDIVRDSAGGFLDSYPSWFVPSVYAVAVLSTLGSILVIILLATRGSREYCKGRAAQAAPRQPQFDHRAGY
ncbi:hypothetical protein [Salininema proteolyticum]|uniref:Uncharacterized protein n=1 Tax=Salininema proteolyticum TaxID=1607685 RepID=A0ABV8TU22_9ACTN